MSEVKLSEELGQVLDDYHEGKDIGEPLELCVDLAASLESELDLHRLRDVDRLAQQVVEGTTEDILAGEESRVVRVDFGKFKEREDGRGI